MKGGCLNQKTITFFYLLCAPIQLLLQFLTLFNQLTSIIIARIG
jgi:hypothetical protein